MATVGYVSFKIARNPYQCNKCYNKFFPLALKVVIITRPHEVEYPFFEAAHAVWRRNQPRKEYYISLLEEIGFRVSVTVFDYPAKLNITWWTNMVRNRFWSTFSEFNDKEILSGINEIKEKYGNSGFVDFTEKIVLIVAEKK